MPTPAPQKGFIRKCIDKLLDPVSSPLLLLLIIQFATDDPVAPEPVHCLGISLTLGSTDGGLESDAVNTYISSLLFFFNTDVVKVEVKAGLRHEKWLMAVAEENAIEHQNYNVFFTLWKSGLLKDFSDYGLIVDKGQPVLFVRIQKSTITKVESKLSSSFQDPAGFYPCKQR